MQQRNPSLAAYREVAGKIKASHIKKIFKAPVFIVSAPRAGSTLLYEVLLTNPDFWNVGGESHPIFAAFPGLRAENAAMDSGALNASHADPETARFFRAACLFHLRNSDGLRYLDIPRPAWPGPVRLLEKTPRNALNIPFLLKLFPDARFVFLYRDPRENISSIMEAWSVGMQSGRFVTFESLPGWHLGRWCLLLPPGWRELDGKSLADIAAFQWRTCNNIMLTELKKLPPARWMHVGYSELINNTAPCLKAICEFSGVRLGKQISALSSGQLPHSSTIVTPPRTDKWKRHEAEILAIMPRLKDTIQQLKSL